MGLEGRFLTECHSKLNKINQMKHILVLSSALGITCLVAGFVLFQAENLTAEAREQARLAERFAAMEATFPECDFDKQLEPIKIISEEGREILFYPARHNGELVGFAAFGESRKGYGGRVRTLTGIDWREKKIRRVSVTEHAETPGLGTQVTDRRRQKKIWDLWRAKDEPETESKQLEPNRFLDQFDQRSTSRENFRVVDSQQAISDPERDLVAITGATVSSQAVAEAVELTLRVFQQNKMKIYAKATEDR